MNVQYLFVKARQAAESSSRRMNWTSKAAAILTGADVCWLWFVGWCCVPLKSRWSSSSPRNVPGTDVIIILGLSCAMIRCWALRRLLMVIISVSIKIMRFAQSVKYRSETAVFAVIQRVKMISGYSPCGGIFWGFSLRFHIIHFVGHLDSCRTRICYSLFNRPTRR